jgi:hypothetical protein
MAPRKQPKPEHRSDTVKIVLTGLASGQDVDRIFDQLGALHIRNDTFPAEELLELASDAIDESGATTAEPIDSRTSGNGSYRSTNSPERISTTRASTPSPPPP